jgi:FkbH-like protein
MKNPDWVVRLVSDFTLDLLGRYLENSVDPPVCTVEAAPYGQVYHTLLEAPPQGEAPPHDRANQVAVVWTLPDRVIEPFARAVSLEPVDAGELLEAVDRFAAALTTFKARVHYLFVPAWVLLPSHRGYGMLDWRPDLGLAALVARMNVRLAERLSSEPGIFVLDTQRWLYAGEARAASPKLWFASKVPFGNPVFQAAAADVRAALLGVSGRARKLIVTDLDETMWGGVVGETGWEGIVLGGHSHLGEAYVAYQKALKAMTNRGVQLGIVSKNDEAVALAALDQHPEMVLRRQDFAGYRINWRDKAENIVELVREINLGLEAVVFLDDNPAERSRVREALPDVLVPELPADPTMLASSVFSLRCFDTPAISQEDRARVGMYAAERRRREALPQVGSIEEWIASSRIEVAAEPLQAADMARAVQLLNKTNQMNLSTRRLSESELMAWLGAGRRCLWTVRVRDRFGDYGLTGLVSLTIEGPTARIVDFVLSCRVMGRRVEECMVHLAVAAAYGWGAREVVAEHRPTARNLPCLRFWETSGFERHDEHEFRWRVRAPYPPPRDVTLNIQDAVFRTPAREAH